MKEDKPYRLERLSFLRKAVRASASITRDRNVIHFFTEVDVTAPLEILRRCGDEQGMKLSFTGYLAKALGETVEKHPGFNSFIAGNRQVFLRDIDISILVERKIGDASVPEPMILRNVPSKSIGEITREIREAQKRAKEQEEFGSLSDNRLLRFIPGFLFKTFVRLADRSIRMGVRYGKLAITSVGMFGSNPFWVIPHGSATVLLSVGSIREKKRGGSGKQESGKHLCLTVSFDHDIIDGAPAARFMNDLIEEVRSGRCLEINQ